LTSPTVEIGIEIETSRETFDRKLDPDPDPDPDPDFERS